MASTQTIVIRDAIHGDITFSPRFSKLIETKAFQRLRRIKQLATAEFVFPGANHTRFSHSIGTYHLMSMFIARFEYLFAQVDVPFSNKEKEALLAAALLHDIGHGPYSHLFEGFDNAKSHEKWTLEIIEKDDEIRNLLLGNNQDCRILSLTLACLKKEFKGRIKYPCAEMLSSLISGQFDVDRLDYLMRDAYYSGIPYGNFDVQKLISSISLSEHNGRMCICFEESAVSELDHFFYCRFIMYNNVYYAPYKVMTEGLLKKIGYHISHMDNTDNDELSFFGKQKQGKIELVDYLNLDDTKFISEISKIQERDEEDEHKDEVLKEMITNFRNRSGFSHLVIMNNKVNDYIEMKEAFLRRFEFDIENLEGVIYEKKLISAYSPSSPVLIVRRDGVITTFDKVSVLFSSDSKNDYDDIIMKKVLCFLYINTKLIQIETGIERYSLMQFFNEYSIRNNMEIEEKFWCSSKTASKALRVIKTLNKNYSVSKRKKIKITDMYFDTETFNLKKSKCSFRHRNEDDKCNFTIKISAEDNNGFNNGQFVRTEKSIPCTGEDVDHDKWSKETRETINNILVGNVKEVASKDVSELVRSTLIIKNTRQSYIIKSKNNLDTIEPFICEVAIDDITFINPMNKKSAKDYQIEVELKNENPIYRVKLRNFVEEFKKQLGENTDYDNKVLAKYIRGLELVY